LSPEGYRVVFDELLKVLREKWPEYPPYKMPFTVKLPWEMEMGDAFWDISG
jgi:isoamyl acetate esterase